jgi:hypothetical protein
MPTILSFFGIAIGRTLARSDCKRFLILTELCNQTAEGASLSGSSKEEL